MDELDQKLFADLSEEIEVPKQFEITIQNALKNFKIKQNKKHYPVYKIVSTACASFVFVSGIAYAGTTLVNKIWKKPQKTVGFYSEENTTPITQKEKETSMSEEQARKKANELLEKFGYKEEKIATIELENLSENYELYWNIQTENKIFITFNAKNPNEFEICDKGALNGNICNYRTTEENAIKTAKEFCKKYEFHYEEYSNVKVWTNQEEKEAYIWFVEMDKEYEGLKNPYECIQIGFIPEINKLYFFHVTDKKFENNSVEITEEQAKNIALEADKKIATEYPMKEAKAQLRIAKMNGFAYLRMTNYEQYRKQAYSCYPTKDIVQYRTDSNVRKVWAVTIQYDVPEEVYFTEVYNAIDDSFIYYIDATTGEIIGGDV